MTTVCVQFSDASKTTIVAVFGCPQNPAEYPNQDEIAVDDARYASYLQGLPAFAQIGLPAS